MKAMKGSSYIYILIFIIVVFFILPSFMVCYNSYKTKENIEGRKLSIEEAKAVCISSILPQTNGPEWILTFQGSMFIIGIISIIILIVVKDLKETKTDRLERYRNYKKI